MDNDEKNLGFLFFTDKKNERCRMLKAFVL
jgi:hypothetical protein